MSDLSLPQTLVIGHIWQSVAVAAVLAGVLVFGKRMRGSTRYGLAAAAFIASIALPLSVFIPGDTIVAGLLKQLNAPVSVGQVETAQSATTKPAPALVAPLAAVLPPAVAHTVDTAIRDAVWMGGGSVAPVPPSPVGIAAAPVASAVKAAPALVTLPEIKMPDIGLPLLAIWLAGVAFMLARTLRDLFAVERLVKRAKPAVLPDALRARFSNVNVATSAEAPGPMAAGLLHPCIVLPESIALASPGMAGLLEHERAHIERRDMLAALGQRIVLALLWWSPALYWISRRIDEEREVACDEAAVDRTGDAKAFARSLTKQAENQLWARAPKLAVGAIGPRSQFGRRIRRLIDIAKSGASPAKYSGRLAFAGLALAVAVAAIVTPRFTASAQELAGPPGNKGAIDITPDGKAKAEKDRAAKGRDGDNDYRFKYDGDDQDWSAFGQDFGKLMESVNSQIRVAMADLSPQLQEQLAGLTADMSGLGADIAAAASQRAIAQMPEIMEQVRKSLEDAGIDVGDIDDWKQFSSFDNEELQQALQEARDELKQKLGPELQEQIRAAIAEARAEVASHKDEIAAAMKESQAGMAVAREAIAAARKEIEAAKARGDFEYKGKWKDGAKFDFDFDGEKIGQQIREQLRAAGIPVDGPQGIHLDGDRHDDRGAGWRLYRAASRCQSDDVSRLIADEKADVNTVSRGDGTALIVASYKGCLDVVRMLLDKGANPNLASQGDGNPLIAASQRGNVDIARLLIERGANVNGASPGDGNPLIAAAGSGKQDVVQLLINRGADVNGYVPGDETPLMAAAERGRLDIVKMLVERGAKVNLAYNVPTWGPDKTHTELRSPLNMAVKHGHDEVAAYLRSKGAVESPPAAN